MTRDAVLRSADFEKVDGLGEAGFDKFCELACMCGLEAARECDVVVKIEEDGSVDDVMSEEEGGKCEREM